MKPECAQPGCPRTSFARDYCTLHLQRLTNGTPAMDAPVQDKRRASPGVRFDRKWVADPKTGCLLWTDHLIKGYGQFRIRAGVQVPAHVFAYEREVGPVPDGLVLDHLCHPIDGTCRGGETCIHRRCINHLHLRPISRGDNARRCVPVHLR